MHEADHPTNWLLSTLISYFHALCSFLFMPIQMPNNCYHLELFHLWGCKLTHTSLWPYWLHLQCYFSIISTIPALLLIITSRPQALWLNPGYESLPNLASFFVQLCPYHNPSARMHHTASFLVLSLALLNRTAAACLPSPEEMGPPSDTPSPHLDPKHCLVRLLCCPCFHSNRFKCFPLAPLSICKDSLLRYCL